MTMPLLFVTLLCVLGITTNSHAFDRTKALISNNFNLDREHVPGQLVVKFKDGFSVNVASEVGALGGSVVDTLAQGTVSVLSFSGFNKVSLLEIAKRLQANPAVEYVEANQIYRINKLPNDPKFDQLFAMNNLGENGGVVDADIDAPEAWELTTGSKDTLVAIIDTGVDYSHRDLRSNYWTNPGESGLDAEGRDKTSNGIDDDGNGFVDDWRGWDFKNNDNDPMDDNKHGTHCAGTIGASGDDGFGVVGVAWNVSLVGVKFLGADGSGTLVDAVKSIDYVSAIGADISSNSWGGGGFSQAMEDAISRNREAGVLFIAAAGNASKNNDVQPAYPASYELDNVISVASTTKTDALSYFSNYGLNSVDIAAPGSDILSTVPGQGHATLSGTSMATPHVSGVAALVKSAYPDESFAFIRNRILKSADPILSAAGNVATGGRLNAYDAVEQDDVAPGEVKNVTVSLTGVNYIELTWDKAGDDNDSGEAKSYMISVSSNNFSSANTTSIFTTTNQTRLENLPLNWEGVISVVAIDNVGNEGPSSQPLPAETIKVDLIGANPADSMDGISADGDWGIEEDDGQVYLADSPDGRYLSGSETVMELPAFAVSSNRLVLAFDVKHDLEKNFDFVYLEVSENGNDEWKTVHAFNGKSDWSWQSFAFEEFLSPDATELNVRFRMVTDRSVEGDGILLDNFQLVAPF